MKTSALIVLLVLIAPSLDAFVLAAVRFTEMEVRDREARGGVKAIRDGVREAYFQNHNRINPKWRLSDIVHGEVGGTFIKASDFSFEFPADKTGWVRIECRDPFPGRDGPLVLEADLASKEEIWIAPGPNWNHVGRAAVILCAGLFLAFVVPFRARRRFARARDINAGFRQPLMVLALWVWWPVVTGLTALALSNTTTTVFETESPFKLLAILPLLVLLIAIECGQTIASLWQEIAPTHGRALLAIQIWSALTIGAVATVFASIFMQFDQAIYAGAAATFAAFILALIPFLRRHAGKQSTPDTLTRRLNTSEAS